MSPIPTEATPCREDLDRLQAELSVRASTLYLARAGIAGMVGLILAGASGKLAWDANRLHSTYAFFAVAVVSSVGLLVFALVSLIRGLRALRSERTRFAQLLSLRQALRLDDPSALLPPR